MKKEFNKGLILTSLGSFWWGFIGVIYFELVSFIGHTELVVHRCLWTALMLIITTNYLLKWNIFTKIINQRKNLISLFFSGFLIFVNWAVWIYAVASDRIIDANQKFIIPGVIDPQVHFREPGLTHKEDIKSGARAAVCGGITTFFEMPNTNPATTNSKLLEEKFKIAEKSSVANFSFFLGATPNNINEIMNLKGNCGVKIFMGSSIFCCLFRQKNRFQTHSVFKYWNLFSIFLRW